MPESDTTTSEVEAAVSPADCPHELARTLSLYKGLVEVASLINGITEYRQLLTAIMDVARRVIGAEGSALILLNADTDTLELVVARSVRGEGLLAPNLPIPRTSIAGWVFDNARSANIQDAYEDPRFHRGTDAKSGFRTKAILCVPLRREDRTIGVLQVVNAVGKEHFDARDQEAFEAYALLATTAIEKLRLLEQEKEAARFERELGIATEIQESFLPRSMPLRPDLQFAAHYQPAREVGGDFYDVFEFDSDEIYFVIGDVAGKGVPAALLMAQSLSLLRLIVAQNLEPGEAMTRWNKAMCERIVRGFFVTAALGRIIPSQRRMEMACAGHCLPVLVKPDGTAKEIEIKSRAPLGMLANKRYETTSMQFESGDWVAFYTDGLSESHGPGSQLFGVDRILQSLSRPFENSQEILNALSEAEIKHRAHLDPHDDLTLFVFGFPAGASESQFPTADVVVRRTLEFTSESERLRDVRNFVREFIEQCATDLQEDLDLIVLGLDEACANVIRHAYRGEGAKPIKLTAQADAHEVRFRLRDYAGPLRRDELQGRPLEDIRPGGLGLHFMRRVFETVDFACKGDGTELTLAKRR
ncbi:MAG: SpoIIE family protein phosphatase [Verrucomicrobia bacterium]|nr:SpoIIE family protein phosphatase [Verrucomicrobiota bacterium]